MGRMGSTGRRGLVGEGRGWVDWVGGAGVTVFGSVRVRPAGWVGLKDFLSATQTHEMGEQKRLVATPADAAPPLLANLPARRRPGATGPHGRHSRLVSRLALAQVSEAVASRDYLLD